MTLSEEIKQLQKESKRPCCAASYQAVLDMLSLRGKKSSAYAKDKSRGDSEYYSKLAKKRWKS